MTDNTPDNGSNPPVVPDASTRILHTEELSEQKSPASPPAAETPDADVSPPENPFKRGSDDKQPDAASEPAGDDTVAPYEMVSDPKYLAMAKEYHEDAVAIARDSGIPAQAVEAVLHYVLGEHAAAAERDAQGALSPGQLPGVPLSNERACYTILQRQFGAMTSEVIRQSGEAFKKLPPDTQAYLTHMEADGSRLSNSPYLTIALALHNSGYTNMSKAQAERELNHLRSKSSLDALDKAKLAITRHLVSRGKSRDANLAAPAKAAKVVPIAHAAIQKRMDAIRRDPNYYGGDARLRKVLIAEMTELHTKLAEGRK